MVVPSCQRLLKPSGCVPAENALVEAVQFIRHSSGTDAALELNGHEKLSFTPREGEAWVKDFPKTDIEYAELAAFAAAATGGPAYPLPVEEAIHGVAVFEAMIGAAASGSTYRVA